MDFMTEIAPKLELDEEIMDEYAQCVENIIDRMMFQVESRCPEYRKSMKQRKGIEEKVFAEHAELKDVHFKSQVETDYALLKSAFLLGVKTGIKLAR